MSLVGPLFSCLCVSIPAESFLGLRAALVFKRSSLNSKKQKALARHFLYVSAWR